MLESIREDVTRILTTSELQFSQPAEMQLPELPDFLTGHIDPFFTPDAGGEASATPVFGGAGTASALIDAGVRPGEDPYKDMNLNRNAACP